MNGSAYNRRVARLRLAVFTSALVLATLAAAGPAAAQGGDTDRQIAQQLFDDGRALLEAKRYPEACTKFAESQRLDPGGGTLLNLAVCHELEGKTATAWSEFRDALGQAVKDERKDREDIARTHIADLATKLMRVVVHVPEAVSLRDPEINLDKSRLPPTAWNTPIPVDPGEHRVSVSAPGAEPWSTTVTVSEPGKTYSVELPSLEAQLVCPEGQTRSQSTCVPIPWDESKRGRSTAFWVTLGGAGALFAASAVTGIVALNADGYVKDNCSGPRDFCSVSDANEAATRAKTFAWISTLTLAGGGIATLVAFVLPREQVRKWGGTPAAVTLGLGSLRITGM